MKSFFVLLILIALFVAAIVWISRNGGWQDEGCTGNCKGCKSNCNSRPQEGPEQN